MDVRTQLYNTNGGTTQDLISVIFSLMYLCFLAFWVFVCFKNRPSVHKIHILMGVLLFTATVDLIFGPADKQYAKLTNNAHGSWDVLIYTFKFSRLVIFHTVILLIGSGWSYLKPAFLPPIETILLLIVIMLNVATVVIREANPFRKDWLTWTYEFIFVDLICWITVWIPNLRSVIWLNKAGRIFANKLLLDFLIAVGLYSFFSRYAVFIVKSIADCDYEWMSAACNVTEEIFSLVFCMVMFYMFRPVNKYFAFVVEEAPASQKTKSQLRKRKKKNPGQVSFSYPKLPEDYQW